MSSLFQTGVLDEETMTMMDMPRCGVKDVVGKKEQLRRKKRYALQGERTDAQTEKKDTDRH